MTHIRLDVDPDHKDAVLAALAWFESFGVVNVREQDPATEEEIEEARRLHVTEEIEVDGDAVTSRADEGLWVSAWVWLARPLAEDDED